MLAVLTPTSSPRRATMEIKVIDGKVSLRIDGAYTAEELSKLAQQIGQARAQIAKDPETPQGLSLEAIALPKWYTELNTFVGLHQLCLRGSLGWQAFLLSPIDVASLIHLFSGQLAQLLRAQGTTAATAAAATSNDDPD